MSLEKSSSVDQRRQRLDQFWRQNAERLSLQGSIVATYRRRGATRAGPYFQLTCRDATGCQRAIYLGPASPLVEEVRSRLAALQQKQRTQRSLRRARRAVRRELKEARAVLAAQLAAVGLSCKGSEVRGWRSSVSHSPQSNHQPLHTMPPSAARGVSGAETNLEDRHGS